MGAIGIQPGGRGMFWGKTVSGGGGAEPIINEWSEACSTLVTSVCVCVCLRFSEDVVDVHRPALTGLPYSPPLTLLTLLVSLHTLAHCVPSGHFSISLCPLTPTPPPSIDPAPSFHLSVPLISVHLFPFLYSLPSFFLLKGGAD